MDQTGDNWLNPRLVSSLRQHTQREHSPTFGHQARNNSAASLLPGRDDALSREALLAQQVSLNRRLRRRGDGVTKKSTGKKWRSQSKEPTSCRFFPSRHRRRLKNTVDSTSSHRVLQGRFGLRREA